MCMQNLKAVPRKRGDVVSAMHTPTWAAFRISVEGEWGGGGGADRGNQAVCVGGTWEKEGERGAPFSTCRKKASWAETKFP